MVEKIGYKYLANIIMCILICILNISFNAAYASYFFIVSGVYILYLLYRFKLRVIVSIPRMFKVLVGVFIAFYGLLFFESLVLQDKNSIRTSFELMKYSLPVFIIGIIGFFKNTGLGIKWGILISSFFNSTVAVLQQLGVSIGDIRFLPRVSGFFEHPNTLASVIAVTTPFLIYFMSKSKNNYHKVLY